MAKNTIFVAGTDTDVGKTVIAAGLLQAANDKGLRTVAVKPVAAGCEQADEGCVIQMHFCCSRQRQSSLPMSR